MPQASPPVKLGGQISALQIFLLNSTHHTHSIQGLMRRIRTAYLTIKSPISISLRIASSKAHSLNTLLLRSTTYSTRSPTALESPLDRRVIQIPTLKTSSLTASTLGH